MVKGRSGFSDDALADVGESDRTAVLLRYFRNCSFSKVGELIGISEEAARKRVGRGLERLREHLAKRGIASTEALRSHFALEGQAGLAAPAGLAAKRNWIGPGQGCSGGATDFQPVAIYDHHKVDGGRCRLGRIVRGRPPPLRESGIVSAATAEYLAKEKDYQVLLTQVQQLRQSERSAQQEVSDLKAAIASAREKNRRAAARTRRNSGTAPSSADKEAKRGHALLAAGPELEAERRSSRSRDCCGTSQTAAANAIFGRFFPQMGWSPSQIAAFDEFVAAHGDINLNYAILTPSSRIRNRSRKIIKISSSFWAATGRNFFNIQGRTRTCRPWQTRLAEQPLCNGLSTHRSTGRSIDQHPRRQQPVVLNLRMGFPRPSKLGSSPASGPESALTGAVPSVPK